MRIAHLTAAITAAAALAFAGCGSDDDDTGGTGSTPSTAAAPASTAKGEPIVLGAICSCTGASAKALGTNNDVAKAWADSVNAKGGINGHPVKLITKDDGGVPARGIAAAKQLVEEDEVVAIIGDSSTVDGAWQNVPTDAGVPVVGGLAPEAVFLTNPNFFATGSSLPVVTVGSTALAKEAGSKKIGILYCAEAPACAQLDPIAKAAAKLAGLGYTSGKIAGTAPNYTAPCLKLKGDGVDSLFVANQAAIVQRVHADCVGQGYEPQVVNQASTASSDWLKDPNLDGAQMSTATVPITDDSVPAVKEFFKTLDTFAPGVRSADQFSNLAVFAYLGGKLFEKAAAEVNLTADSTSADVKKGLYALKDETLDGMMPPTTYTEGKPAFPACYWVTGIEDGKFTAPKGTEPTCLTPAETKELLGAL